jgi:hypothetical protein
VARSTCVSLAVKKEKPSFHHFKLKTQLKFGD